MACAGGFSMSTHREDEMPLILIIDDDALVRATLRRVLEADGYDVTEAGDGRAGLRAFRARPAEVVLCDMVMPDMEGAETITALLAERPAPAIIAMSGRSPDPLATARALGARATLRKPFAFGDLRRAVGHALTPERTGVMPAAAE